MGTVIELLGINGARPSRAGLGVDGVGDYSIYILRHSTASNLHERGASVATIQEILGHSSIQTTNALC